MKEEAVTIRERTAVLLSKLEGSFEEMDLKQRLIEGELPQTIKVCGFC